MFSLASYVVAFVAIEIVCYVILVAIAFFFFFFSGPCMFRFSLLKCSCWLGKIE